MTRAFLITFEFTVTCIDAGSPHELWLSRAGAETPATVPLLQVSPVTASQLAELDQLLNMEPGNGIAGLLLGDILRDFKAGSLDVLNCWEWEDPEATVEAVRAVADRWRQEDGKQDDPANSRDMCGRWEIERLRTSGRKKRV